jgi:hypothetical protein
MLDEEAVVVFEAGTERRTQQPCPQLTLQADGRVVAVSHVERCKD